MHPDPGVSPYSRRPSPMPTVGGARRTPALEHTRGSAHPPRQGGWGGRGQEHLLPWLPAARSLWVTAPSSRAAGCQPRGPREQS